jgi:hypothetical protein
MSTLFTLTVTDQSQMSKAQEVQTIERALSIAAVQVRSQKIASSGNIVVEGGNVIGSWSYTSSNGHNG